MTRLITAWTITLGLLSGIFSFSYGEDEFKPVVDFKGSRMAIGYLDSGRNGSYPAGSYQMPEAKLRFNLQMSPDIKVVTRMNLNNATFKSVDYMYLDYQNLFATLMPSLKDSAFNPLVRVGLMKVDFGEETWGNNPVEAASITPSATNTGAYDEGLQFSQSYPKEKTGIPLKWSLSMTNGNTDVGVGADNQQSKAVCAKFGINPVNELYVSGSYYNSAQLLGASADMTYAGLATPPTNANRWIRTISELDLRYDIKPGKENRLEPGAPAWSDSLAFFRVAYGQFKDDGRNTAGSVVPVTNRKGSYYFIEGTYNATEKGYLTARYSFVGFDNSTFYDTLNTVKANDYTRTSAGVGYRLSATTQLKAEYLTNSYTLPAGTTKPETGQIAVLFTTKF